MGEVRGGTMKPENENPTENEADVSVDPVELLVEEVSIDGLCGVY
jgi:mycofactocin precursor